MRLGDLTVTLVPEDDGALIEQGDGRVLARPGQVYRIRVTNHRFRRALLEIAVDGHSVTENGLILPAWGTVELERPVTEGADGRFTVYPEGNTDVFGPDGGASNEDLGLIVVRSRWEAANSNYWVQPWQWVTVPVPVYPRPYYPWSPPCYPYQSHPIYIGGNTCQVSWTNHAGDAAYNSTASLQNVANVASSLTVAPIEGAAGTGLTGQSAQRFGAGWIGCLESIATEIRLRLVIGAKEAFRRARPLPGVVANAVPSRPREGRVAGAES